LEKKYFENLILAKTVKSAVIIIRYLPPIRVFCIHVYYSCLLLFTFKKKNVAVKAIAT